MKTAALVLLTAGWSVASTGFAQDSGGLEIRFCPAAQVRTFPLESARDAQSLLLQNAVVINHGAVPAEITDVTLELLRGSAAVDSRRLVGAELKTLAASGPQIQQSGMMKLIAFQFCGNALIADGVKFAGPTLARNQALLIFQQPFGYKGKRDAVRMRVHARVTGHDVEVAAMLPIRSDVAKTALNFPLHGVWFAGVGPTMHTGHRWALPEEFAYDIVRIGDGGLTHRGDGERFEDYYAYGADVLAAGDGVVTAIMNDQSENASSLRRHDETSEAFAARLEESQAALLMKGAAGIAGNYVIIDHGNSEYSLYAHMKPGSVRVNAGNRVHAGMVLGQLGSSGNSTEPHLHFQVCDAADPLLCAGIPVQFANVSLPFADYQRPVQSGDVVIAH